MTGRKGTVGLLSRSMNYDFWVDQSRELSKGEYGSPHPVQWRLQACCQLPWRSSVAGWALRQSLDSESSEFFPFEEAQGHSGLPSSSKQASSLERQAIRRDCKHMSICKIVQANRSLHGPMVLLILATSDMPMPRSSSGVRRKHRRKFLVS